MSYKSKRTITSMVVGILIFVFYISYAFGKNSPGSEDLRAWAIAILIFIGIGVICLIVVHILFYIVVSIGIAVKEQGNDDKIVEERVQRIVSSSMVEDEMDRLINLKSGNIGYICIGVGFIAALIALAIGVSAVFAFHILFFSFGFGSIIEGSVSVYLYERGVHNG